MPGPEDASTSREASKENSPMPPATFKSLGLIDPLLEALERVGFKQPTEIQAEALPHALEGRDIIGIASTGSGKTAAFALPILQKLWEEPKGLFACVLAPTRELAYQISEQFEALGSAMGVRCAVLIGGMDMPTQQIMLAKTAAYYHWNSRSTSRSSGDNQRIQFTNSQIPSTPTYMFHLSIF